MSGQEAFILNKIGPYDGPYEKNIITYKLKLYSGDIIAWHENGRRGLDAEIGDIITGLWVQNGRPNYKMSLIKHKQTKLF